MPVGALIFGTSPFGCSDLTVSTRTVDVDAVSCAERRTRKMLGELPNIFDTDYDASLQSDILYAIAKSLCRWQAARAGMVSDTRLASAYGVALERVGGHYGVGRQGLALTDEQYRALVRALRFRPKGTRAAIVRVCRAVFGLTPTIEYVGPYHIRVVVPLGDALQDGFGLGLYPSANVTDDDTVGCGRGYAAEDLTIEDSTGLTYIFGSAIGDAERSIIEQVVVAGVTVDLASE